MIKRLRIKLICITMAIVTVMLGIIFATVLHFTKTGMEMESIRRMQAAAAAPSHAPGPPNRYFTVETDRNGKLQFRNREASSLTEEDLQAVLEQLQKTQEQTGILSSYDLRYVRLRTPDGMKLVFDDISHETQMLNNLIQNCLLIGAGSLLIFFLISVLLARWAVKPMEQTWTQQRQFVADASHELKTPLTVILTNAELLQAQEYSPEQKESFARNILTMSQQMRGLTENLLELARVDAGCVHTKKETVDLSAILTNAVLSFEVMFFEKGLQLESAAEKDLPVWGSSSHLHQVITILLDNALKYSAPGITQVQLVRQGGNAVLKISNPGPAISREDLKNIFKRFYRMDSARSMNRSYGLGLSIAEAIVHDHKGKIKAESENGRNTFTVILPLR